jgi:hypothetical protein
MRFSKLLAASSVVLAMAGGATAGVFDQKDLNCVAGALYGNLNSASVRMSIQLSNSCGTPLTVQVFNSELQPHPVQFVTFPAGEQGVVTYLVPSRGSLRVTPQVPNGGATFSVQLDILR